MNPADKSAPSNPSASEYILDNFDSTERVAMLVLNRDFREVIQRITSAQKAASPEFQAWLRYKNANGSDIYIGMNPLKKDAATRTKEEIENIRHVYLDLDQGGAQALEAIENSNAVPKPNYVLNSSPEKHQVVWKVEGMNLEEAEALLHAMAREFGGDPAATDATRVLRLPGFANKKYGTNFYVEAHRESEETYHLHDFKLDIGSQDCLRHRYENRTKRVYPLRSHLSQSEHDWAFAMRALIHGDNPEEVVQQIAKHRAADKPNPLYYARLTVQKAQAEIEQMQREAGSAKRLESTPPNEPLSH